MNYLYSSPLLGKMEDWLDSYDVDLLTTGVLALGNFARTDSHCIQMVQRGITKKLLCKKFSQTIGETFFYSNLVNFFFFNVDVVIFARK